MSRQMFNLCLTGLLIKSYHPMMPYDDRCRYQLPATPTTTSSVPSPPPPLLPVLANSFGKLFGAITTTTTTTIATITSRLRCAHQLTIDEIYRESLAQTVNLVVKGYSCSPIRGTGCVVFVENGLVLTCAHVVADMRQSSLYYNTLLNVWPGSRRARVLYVEPHHDLALVKIQYTRTTNDKLKQDLVAYDLQFTPAIDFGDDIICFGYPTDNRLTVTTGCTACPQCIEYNREEIYVPMASGHHESRSGVSSGFSGGPVVDLDGELIGITHSLLLTESIRIRSASRTSIYDPDNIGFIKNAIKYDKEKIDYKNNRKLFMSQSYTLDSPFGGYQPSPPPPAKKTTKKQKGPKVQVTDEIWNQRRRRRLQIEVCWYSPSRSTDYMNCSLMTGHPLPDENINLREYGIFVYRYFNKRYGNDDSLLDFDIIREINGKIVETIDDLSLALVANNTIRLAIVRSDQQFDINISSEELTGNFNYI
ncbi:serine protease HTRA1-like [Oppia nitens]|uniref:serine protease HTRA1-like n=1 Tax=Oppia nitens TaxID=1686743 RepID=UPI0023DBE93C|nr:serine protease HTRA1-like [Oppia nitens]